MTCNRPFSPIRYLATCSIVAAFCALVAGSAFGAEPNTQIVTNSQIIYGHSLEMRCAAEDMRDEIKTHFKGTNCYRKMLGTNTLIKLRSAAISRRVKRNPCYAGMERDLARLNELLCEFGQLYETAIQLNAIGNSRCCIQGDASHVANQLFFMADLANGMTAASQGLILISAPTNFSPGQPANIIPDFDPNLQPAPGVTPATQNRLRLNYEPATSTQPVTPLLEGPQPTIRSVLDR
jgi:hypothetical protein